MIIMEYYDDASVFPCQYILNEKHNGTYALTLMMVLAIVAALLKNGRL